MKYYQWSDALACQGGSCRSGYAQRSEQREDGDHLSAHGLGLPGRQTGIFDFFAAGGLVITEDFPDLHEYFKVGREVIAFTDTEDMLKKVRYYLDHLEEADAIRQAGRKRVVENYTWKKAWPAILKTALPLAD